MFHVEHFAGSGSPRMLPVESLKPGRYQNRRVFDPDKLEELANSIREQGVVQPLVVRYDKRDGLYEILAGERRWRAATLAEEWHVPVVVRNDLDDDQAHMLCLVENLQRDDLNPIEEAQGYQALLDRGLKQREIAQKLGVSRSQVANAVRLLSLATDVQQWIIEGKLSSGQGKPLLAVPHRLQSDIAGQAVRLGWTVRRIEKQVAAAKKITEGKGLGKRHIQVDPNVERLRLAIEQIGGLPTRMTLDREGRGGTIELRFFSVDELEGFLDRLSLKSSA